MMRIQEYSIHLVNGEHFNVKEDYYLPRERSVVGKFMTSKADDTLVIGDETSGYFYIPKCNIMYITAGEFNNR